MAPGDESSTLGILPAAAGVPAARPRAPRFPLLYQFLRGGCAPMLHSIFGLEVSGLERLPADGAFILAANHHNYLDGVVLGVAVPRPINFLVMPRVFHASPLHPPFHRRLGSIPVNLERPDPGAIKRPLRALEQGGVVGIFPEGPFSREGQLVSGQPGVAMIAYETQLNQDLRWALQEGSMHFEEASAVHQTLRRVVKRLDELGVPYAVVGGMALFLHGYRRFTEDVHGRIAKCS